MTEILSNTPAVSTAARTASRHAKAKALPVEPKSVTWNPSADELRKFTEQMPNCRKTEFGNVNVATKVVSRSKLSTFIATDRAEEHSDQTISRAEYDRISK